MLGFLKKLFGKRGPASSASYRRLVHEVFGDDAAAERLIAFEIRRDPLLSREEAIKKAVDRLEYERSR